LFPLSQVYLSDSVLLRLNITNEFVALDFLINVQIN